MTVDRPAGRPPQLPLDLPALDARGRADFLEAQGNREALGWIDRWPDWPAPAAALWGPAGCGKTHLVLIWATRAEAALLDVAALARATVADLDAAIPPSGAVAVDDADRICGEAASEQALFHLYNLLAARRGTLLVAGGEPPARWPIRLPDLASRLRAAPAIRIEPPDDALLAAILVKLFADRQVTVGEGVVQYLARHMERTPAAARRIVAELDRRALAAKRPITVPLAVELLAGPAARS